VVWELGGGEPPPGYPIRAREGAEILGGAWISPPSRAALRSTGLTPGVPLLWSHARADSATR